MVSKNIDQIKPYKKCLIISEKEKISKFYFIRKLQVKITWSFERKICYGLTTDLGGNGRTQTYNLGRGNKYPYDQWTVGMGAKVDE